MSVPTRVIKKILDDPGLLRKYKMHGEGTYKLLKYPHIVAVVSNYKVITCYGRFEAHLRLEELSKYMDYYIEELVHQKRNGFSYKIKSFREFRKTLYK
jgi:hypothetical protein